MVMPETNCRGVWILDGEERMYGLFTQRLVVIDIEGRGYLDQGRFSICEIGCVEVEKGRLTGGTLHCRINPQAKVNPHAGRIHGLTARILEDCPTFEKVATPLMDFIGDSVLVAHGAASDRILLNHDLALLGRTGLPKSRFLCMTKIARMVDRYDRNMVSAPGKMQISLKDLSRQLGVGKQGDTHDALGDATLSALCLSRILELDIPQEAFSGLSGKQGLGSRVATHNVNRT